MKCWICGKEAVSLLEYDGKIYKALCKDHLKQFEEKRTKEINKQLKAMHSEMNEKGREWKYPYIPIA